MAFCQACGLRGNKEDHYPAGPYSTRSRGNSRTVPPPHRAWLVAILLPHTLSPRPKTHKQTWTQSCKITTLVTPHRLSQGTLGEAGVIPGFRARRSCRARASPLTRLPPRWGVLCSSPLLATVDPVCWALLLPFAPPLRPEESLHQICTLLQTWVK